MPGIRTQSAPALDRALTILESLANSRKGLSLSQIAKKLGLARSSAYCLLLTLERRGYLARNIQTRRYMFGLKLFSLANMALAGIELREVAHPFLNALMESTRLTIHMAILEQNEAVLVDKFEPTGLWRLATWIGKRMDAHCTGVGKALLAYMPAESLDNLLKERGLPRHNQKTISSSRKLKEELARIREVGYSFDDEEDELGLRCIGCPIFDQAGNVPAAISIAGTTAQITRENESLVASKVKQTALSISKVLGFNPTKM